MSALSAALGAPPAAGPAGRYRLPSGSSALVYPGSQGPTLHLLSPKGEQRVAWTRSGAAWQATLLGGEQLEFRPDGASLLVRVRPASGPARSERWKASPVRVPVSLAVLQGQGAFPRVSPEQVRESVREVAAQLQAVYGPIGLSFVLAPPTPIAAARVDLDGDGRLTKEEVRGLRDHLERIGLKQPGRVVLALTPAPIVGSGCRGWTLGDSVATPHTLTDLNDNFSIVNMRFVKGHHTVPHEIGHQFGLDDLGRENRRRLDLPQRTDHLMDSGGEGVFLDPQTLLHMHQVTTHPDLGLAGRRTAIVAPPAPREAAAPAQGLGAPPSLTLRR
ncbi:MAG: hypothetical protein KDD82_07475 [Planctomycetes bacterium]|nr:hypothetical protein [Planctomycetota bacterium]